MIDPDVRLGVAADVDQLEWLQAEARAGLAEQRGGQRWLATHQSRADRWLATIEGDNVFVAHIGDVLVGYLVLLNATPVAVIDDVYVTPQARELGFGDAMLAAALERGRQLGCTLVEGEALPGDRNTKNLYERAAIKARLITVSAQL